MCRLRFLSWTHRSFVGVCLNVYLSFCAQLCVSKYVSPIVSLSSCSLLYNADTQKLRGLYLRLAAERQDKNKWTRFIFYIDYFCHFIAYLTKTGYSINSFYNFFLSFNFNKLFLLIYIYIYIYIYIVLVWTFPPHDCFVCADGSQRRYTRVIWCYKYLETCLWRNKGF